MQIQRGKISVTQLFGVFIVVNAVLSADYQCIQGTDSSSVLNLTIKDNDDQCLCKSRVESLSYTVVCDFYRTNNKALAHILEQFDNKTKLTLRGNGVLHFLKIQTWNTTYLNVTSLDAGHSNQLFVWPRQLLAAFPNLQHVRVHNCNVIDVEDDAFAVVPQLKTLELTMCRHMTFEALGRGLGANPPAPLTVLNVSGIYSADELVTASIKPPFFQNLGKTSLQVLDASWTRLMFIYDTLENLRNLTTINITGTFVIGSFDCLSTILDLPNLRTFTLDHWPVLTREYKSITFIGDSEHLLRRSVTTCRLFALEDNSTGCMTFTAVRTLQLRFINLDSFFWDFSTYTCFSEDSHLVNLVLSGSKTNRQVGPFGVDKLKLLDVSYLDSLSPVEGSAVSPHLVRELPNLVTFLAPGVRLGRLTEAQLTEFCAGNPMLQFLNIADNEISYIPKYFLQKNTLLQHFNVSGNRLSHLVLNFQNHSYLEVIDISRNNIKILSAEFFASLRQLNSGLLIFVDTTDNSIECTCDLNELVDLKHITVTGQCIYARKWYGIEYVVKHEHDFKASCEVDSKKLSVATLVGIIVGCICTIILITIATVVCYILRRQGNRQSEEPLFEINYERDSLPEFIAFFSHSSKDAELVLNTIFQQVNHYLESHCSVPNLRSHIFIGDRDFSGGRYLHDEIEKAIKNSYVTVCFLSRAFLASDWCKTELRLANHFRVPIIPIFLERCEPDEMPCILRHVFDTRARLFWPENASEQPERVDQLCRSIIDHVHATSVKTRDNQL